MTYVVVGLIIAVVVAVMVMIAKKDSKERDEMVSKLTEEQKEFLKATASRQIFSWPPPILLIRTQSKYLRKMVSPRLQTALETCHIPDLE